MVWRGPLIFIAAVTFVATGDAKAQCPDLFRAQEASDRCERLAERGQCQPAALQCARAVKLCPSKGTFSLQLQRLDASCSAQRRPALGKLGRRCRRDAQCRTELQCSAGKCQKRKGVRVSLLQLQVNARRIAAHSPCDARALMERACTSALLSQERDLQPRIQASLGQLRALCPAFNGEVCRAERNLLSPMVSIPAGPFIRGSSQRGLDGGLSLCRDTYSKPVDCTTQWFKREVPQRSVVLSAFEIDRFEVTNSQFTTCVKAGACGPVKYEECSIYNLSSGVWSTGTSGGPELHNPHHPVVCVTWKQANDFCAWAGKRLPSEAQWEKAARGDKDARDFPWGDRWSPALLNWGELGGFGKIDGYKTTAPVGAFPYNVSPYGAYDMAGNAWEWTSDPFDAGFYTRDPMVDPENDSPANLRSLRGGSWSFSGNGARLTYRFFASEDHRDDGIGFRCAK